MEAIMRSIRLIIWRDYKRNFIESIFDVEYDKFFRKDGSLTKAAAKEIKMAMDEDYSVTMDII